MSFEIGALRKSLAAEVEGAVIGTISSVYSDMRPQVEIK